MVDGDSNGRDDVFVYDQVGGATARVSVDSTGAQANGPSSEPSIAGDGRYVAFGSSASNLVSGDTNGAADVFVHDRTTGATTRVSVDGSGAQANKSSGSPSISADGRYVAFGSSASNLVGGDTNAADDIFVRDRSAATTTRVSVDSAGAQANAPSRSAAISGNGGFVAFDSAASNLVGADTNSVSDVFVRSLGGATTTRVSVTSGGGQANGTSSSPSISSDGGRIAFASSAALASGDGNGGGDIYVRDRAANQTTWATGWAANQGWTTGGTSSSPSISANGRYVALALHSDVQIDDLNRARDIYEYDLATGAWAHISRDDVRGAGNKVSDSPSLSADGKRAAFESSATNFYLDTNGVQDHLRARVVGRPRHRRRTKRSRDDTRRRGRPTRPPPLLGRHAGDTNQPTARTAI
jgi:Tol biopolymer transport system component